MPEATYPDSLSPSRASDFQTCPLLYRLRSIDRLPEEPSAAAIKGSLVHQALEWLYESPAHERTLGTLEAGFLRACKELSDRDRPSYEVFISGLKEPTDDQLLRQVANLLSGYFRLENPRYLEPFSREQELSTPLTETFHIRGFVDRIDRAPDGRIRIIDYKTGKAPSERYAGKALFQLKFYALMWWRNTGEIPTVLQLLYLGSENSLSLTPTPEELNATERKILALRDAITRAVDEGFSPTPGPLCSWCSFKDLCPAFGGEPPGMPDVSTLIGAASARLSRPSD